MDPKEIKEDLKEILDLASRHDSNATTKNKIIPSAHAILADQEVLKEYRESLNDFNDQKQNESENYKKEEDPSLEKFNNLIMAVTQHNQYNENDDDDFIKVPSLPRGESEITLKADSTENLNCEHGKEEKSLEVHWDLENSTKNREKEVELEVELQVKVNSESDLEAIAKAVNN